MAGISDIRGGSNAGASKTGSPLLLALKTKVNNLLMKIEGGALHSYARANAGLDALLKNISARYSDNVNYANDVLEAFNRASENFDKPQVFYGNLNAASIYYSSKADKPNQAGRKDQNRMLTFIKVWNYMHRDKPYMAIKCVPFPGSQLPKVAGSKNKIIETYWFSDKPVSLENAPVVFVVTIPKPHTVK